MQLILNKGRLARTRLAAGRQDIGIFLRVVWTCILRASPRRAWMTLSMMIETAWRRPQHFRTVVALALIHKHFYEYVRDISVQLDRLIDELRRFPDPGILPPPATASESTVA
jgi:hypothetical protein